MIRANVLSTLYDRLRAAGVPWPVDVVTAYLDTSRNVENAAKMIAVRWRDERRSLVEQGVDESTLDAMGEAVGMHRHPPGPQGQVLVGSHGELWYDAVVPQPPPREIARCGPLPHMMPLVAQLRPLIPHVLAVVDRAGGDVTVHGSGIDDEQKLAGRDYPLHKSGKGGWSAPKYEHRTEKTWAENARLVASFIDSAVRVAGARLVVLAGEVKARTMVRDELGEHSRQLVVEIDEDVRHNAEESEPLQRQVDELIAAAAKAEDDAAVTRFEEEIGQRDKAVQGLEATVAALQQAQVDTLLVMADRAWSDNPSGETNGGEAAAIRSWPADGWIGPDPVHLALEPDDLRQFGVDNPVSERLDAVLLRAAVGTGASIVPLASGRLSLDDGVGALIRYGLGSRPT